MPKTPLAVTRLAGPFVGHRGSGPPALVRRRPGHASQALVTAGGRTLVAAMGRTGIAAFKREGDGATPRCRMLPLVALTSRTVPIGVPARTVRRRDGWCDALGAQAYNRAVRLPARASHEEMARADGLYDVVVVTDHNQRPRVRGAGSAIFLHLARDGLTPTQGCLAFPRAVWQRGGVPLGPYLVGVDPRPIRNRR